MKVFERIAERLWFEHGIQLQLKGELAPSRTRAGRWQRKNGALSWHGFTASQKPIGSQFGCSALLKSRKWEISEMRGHLLIDPNPTKQKEQG